MLDTLNAHAGREENKPEASVCNAGWRRLFAMAQNMDDGTISRVVIQDRAPVFMERSFSDVSLQNREFHLNNGKSGQKSHPSGWSPEWSRLMEMARELVYCEFHDIRIADGIPVSIGRLVKKEKLA
jgi:hypothetical protein